MYLPIANCDFVILGIFQSQILSILPLSIRLVTAESLAKFLFSKDGYTNYLITESFNASDIYAKDFLLSIEFGIRNYHNQQSYKLEVNFAQLKDNESFAVEAFWPEVQNSSEGLKHLIYHANGPMTLRHLTEEESSRLEAFKRRQTGGYLREKFKL